MLLLAAAAQSGAARADVGPTPKCPPGTYHAYLMGHRCVKNGYRLEQNAEGLVVEVRIPGAPVEPAPIPIVPSGEDRAAAGSNPATNPATNSAPTPAPASSRRASGCTAADRGGTPAAALLTALALLVARRGRRLRSEARR
ncbi:MAG: hypothetical protein U1A78_30550 [Polyangia bacterium]